MKECSGCFVVKSLSEFSIDSNGFLGRKAQCKKCLSKKSLDWYYKNRDRLIQKKREYYLNNREAQKERLKAWRKSNPEIVELWRKNNIEKIREYDRNSKKIRNKIRRDNDPLFKMKCTLRTRTSMAFKAKSWSKNSKTVETLGTDYDTAFKHIESQFKNGMSWDNHGDWHIDHIIPLSSATTEEEMMMLCHYTNLQPLWAKENLSKSNKITQQQ